MAGISSDHDWSFIRSFFFISDDVQLQHFYGGKDGASDDVLLQLYDGVDDRQFLR